MEIYRKKRTLLLFMVGLISLQQYSNVYAGSLSKELEGAEKSRQVKKIDELQDEKKPLLDDGQIFCLQMTAVMVITVALSAGIGYKVGYNKGFGAKFNKVIK